MKVVPRQDPVLYKAVMNEFNRQDSYVELIASENFTSPAVMEMQGSILTNKYAEGYPGKRYYGGCKFVDVVESLAIERLINLYRVGDEPLYANVQVHSGSQANMAVYLSCLDSGDKILGMDLNHGGHLTHGSKFNFSGKIFQATSYEVDPNTFLINYDDVAKKAKEFQPKMIVAGASAYPREIDFAKFREIADSIGAYLLVDMAHIAGLIATKQHMSPVPYADFVTSTTHKTLRGPRGGFILTRDPKLAKKVNSAVFPGIQGGPLMHVIAGKAVCFQEAAQEDFITYQKQVIKNSKALAKTLIDEGFSIFTNGTDNHIVLIDLRPQGVTGKQAEEWLEEAHITSNKNVVPFDTQKATVTSGIRLGTPAVTTRGMTEAEMGVIGRGIASVISTQGDEEVCIKVKKEILEICERWPLYSGWRSQLQ